MSWIIVGLGNPGEEYEKTRHNVGRMILCFFAKREKIDVWKEDKKAVALVTRGTVGREKVTLVLPETYMNKSGKAVANFITSVKKAEQLVVVYDDLDLPLGTLKISFGRGSGGHKGLESIIRSIKTKDFVRLRIGISVTTPKGKLKKPKGEQQVLDFILGSFGKKDEVQLRNITKQACDALSMIMTEGRAAATNRFN